MPTGDDTGPVTLSVLLDDDLTHRAGLPLLLLTEDTSLYPHLHAKHTRIQAAYQFNRAAQTVLFLDDQLRLSWQGQPEQTREQLAGAFTASSSSPSVAVGVDVCVLLEPAQVSQAIQLAHAAASSTAPLPAEACVLTPLGRYLDKYLRAIIAAAVEDVSDALHLPDARTSPPTKASEDTAFSVRVHIVVSPNITEASAGTNITNANLSTKEAAVFFAAAHAVESQWHRMTPCEALPGDDVDAHVWRCVRHAQLGFAGVVPSPEQTASLMLAIANKRLKLLRERAPASPVAPLPATPLASTACSTWTRGLPLGPLTADMVRPDAPRKCEPNDFVKLYQSMLSEIVSVSDRRAMAALATFPTMHHLLAHVDEAVSEDLTAKPGGAAGAAVYTRNYGEARRYNVVNEAVLEALACDFNTQP